MIARRLLPCIALASLFAKNIRAQDAAPMIFERGNLVPLVGAHLGTPLKASAYAGVAIVRVATRTAYDGYSIVAEGGLGGARASAGYTTFFFPAAGYRVQLSGLRTMGHPFNTAPGQTYVGLDTQAFLLLTGFELGFYRRVSGSAPHDTWLWSVSLSVGT